MSCAILTALAILSECREIPRLDKPNSKSLSLMFNASIFVNKSTTILAALRFFNHSSYEIDFDASPPGFFIIARVVAMTSGAPILLNPASADNASNSESLIEADFDLVGDILSIAPAGEDARSASPPFVQITGYAENIVSDTASFSINVPQWTHTLPKGVFPASCTIEDSPRYQTGKKPMPNSLSAITCMGVLTEIVREKDGKFPTSFKISVQNVLYLSKPTLSPSSSSTSPATSPAKGKLKYGFSASGLVAGFKRPRSDTASSS